MPPLSMSPILDHLRQLIDAQTIEQLNDGQLLERFILLKDQASFAALMRRHGSMVLGACQRVLGHVHDAEDAFQATFLVLAQKARSIANRDSVASWLHGVSQRLSSKLRLQGLRRQRREERAPAPTTADPLLDAAWRELQAVLDTELQRLPAKYRDPLLLCYLEGKTHEEIARLLTWPVGTVHCRLTRGRDRLRNQLARRGLTLPGTSFAAVLAVNSASAALPAPLLDATLKAARLFAEGKPILDTVSPAAVVLAGEGLRTMTMTKLYTAVGLLLAFGLATGATVLAYQAFQPHAPDRPAPAAAEPAMPQAQEAKPAPRIDRHGDLLPEDAIARLGTKRFRHASWVDKIRISPDGKLVYSLTANQFIHCWEAASGRELQRIDVAKIEGHPLPMYCYALSPDGRMLATGNNGNSIILLEAASGKLVRKLEWQHPNEDGSIVYSLCFSPDGKTLAAGGTELRLWDLASGARRDWPMFDYTIYSAAFSPDGKLLATGGIAQGESGELVDKASLCLWEAATGKMVRELKKTGMTASLAFSPEGKLLADVSQSGEVSKLTLWDVAESKELPPLETARPGSRVAFAPDGKTLAIGFLRSEKESSATELWDLASCKLLRRLPGGVNCVFAPDGKTLATTRDNAIVLFDVATGAEQLAAAGHNWGLCSVAFTPDGTALITEEEGQPTKRVWEIASGKELGQQPGRRREEGAWACSPDGKLIAQEARRLGGDPFDDDIALLNANTRRELRRFRPGDDAFTFSLSFSPNGKLLAMAGQGGSRPILRIWEVDTGKERLRFNGTEAHSFRAVTFSGDGAWLAVACSDHRREPSAAQTVRLWDVAKGKEFRRLGAELGQIDSLAFAPSGRTLAVGNDAGFVYLLEVATGKQRRVSQAHQGKVMCLAFSANGSTLASGSADTTAVVWNVLGQRPPRNLSAGDLESLWADLASDDAAKAFQAIGTLAGAPPQSVPFLQARLRPAADPDPLLAKLLKDLDSTQGDRRQQAEDVLAQLAELAVPALEKSLAAKPSLEIRHRIDRLLERVSTYELPAERLRVWRAIETLEHIGTPEAMQLLRKLGEGTPASRFTQEARAAVERLQRPAQAP